MELIAILCFHFGLSATLCVKADLTNERRALIRNELQASQCHFMAQTAATLSFK
jgi:hypothetical protein